MHAVAGDALRVEGRHVGDEVREGIIVEVHGKNGAPPYLVRWRDGHESVFFPSGDTLVEHLPTNEKAR
ncbi:DUF1918 domain-containing protein [Actinoallomurus liliacearum]|uniref:DUF1918 domain-containing protein n=1 Tax=Actinoallomurus liliacearum TaxID=1080073 RepID=A0ABP8TSU8_9ACTN